MWRLSWSSVGTSADQYVISHGQIEGGAQMGLDLLAAAPSVKLQEVLRSEVEDRHQPGAAGPPAVASPGDALGSLPAATTGGADFTASEEFGGRGQRSQKGNLNWLQLHRSGPSK